MVSELKKKDLEKQGYRLIGNHSAIKICLWAKKSIRNEDVCYKNTFYGINSNRCVQMTPSLFFCNHRCFHCWRDIEFTLPNWEGPVDKPKDIIDGCISAHVEYLQGFGGNPKTSRKKYLQALKPKHFAISLSGEPTFYPKLPELIKELKKRKISSFLVTNGTHPDMLKKLIKTQPTQLYLTLPAPDEQIYKKACNPLIKDSWEKIQQSLRLLNKFKRSTIRLTLVKNINMLKPEKYAELIEKAEPKFVEAKAYVWVGHSKHRLGIENMPLYPEMVNFSKKIEKNSTYKIIDKKKESRVVLLMKKDFKGRVMKF